jgi:hypothetical protein
MSTMLINNDSDYQKFGKNSNNNSSMYMNISGNRKSIKDLISKFDSSEEKTQEKRGQRIDFVSNLNSLKINSNKSESKIDSSRPVSLNFESIKIPVTSINKFKEQPKTVSNSVQVKPVPKSINVKREPQNTRYNQINHEITIDEDQELQLQVSKTRRLTKEKIEPNVSEIPPNEGTCTWNPARRRSSVQLLKPSSLLNKPGIVHEEKIEEETVPEPIILPKRITGPIYESRRSSFSAIKPSEIWDSDELPKPNRRNSRVYDGKINLLSRKKSFAIQECDESLENVEESQSSWVLKKPTPSMNIVKPSNVKSGKNHMNAKINELK